MVRLHPERFTKEDSVETALPHGDKMVFSDSIIDCLEDLAIIGRISKNGFLANNPLQNAHLFHLYV